MPAFAFAVVTPDMISDRRLGASDLRVLLALLTFARPDKPECWPSRETIGERCGIASVSRISAVLSRLVQFGWITIHHRQGSNLYRIHPPSTTTATDPAEPCTPVCTAAVHPALHTKKTREATTLPLYPLRGSRFRPCRRSMPNRPLSSRPYRRLHSPPPLSTPPKPPFASSTT